MTSICFLRVRLCYAGEGEWLLALIHCGLLLPDLAEDVNSKLLRHRKLLPLFLALEII